MRKLFSLFLLFLPLLLISCVPLTEKESYIQNPNYRVIFTTGLDRKNKPLNNLKKISIHEERIYIFVHWNLIPSDTTYHYRCKIYDGGETLVNESAMEFTPNTSGWNTWTWYKILSNADQPGKWKFEIFLEERKVIEKSVIVIAE